MRWRKAQLTISALLVFIPFSFIGLPRGIKDLLIVIAGVALFFFAWRNRNETPIS